MPRRVQRQRKAGQPGMPPGSVYVGRGPGSKWGNPFTVADAVEAGMAKPGDDARRHVTELFRAWLTGELPPNPGWEPPPYPSLADIRRELAGRDLACWCRLPEPGEPDHCHAAVLLQLANSDD